MSSVAFPFFCAGVLAGFVDQDPKAIECQMVNVAGSQHLY